MHKNPKYKELIEQTFDFAKGIQSREQQPPVQQPAVDGHYRRNTVRHCVLPIYRKSGSRYNGPDGYLIRL